MIRLAILAGSVAEAHQLATDLAEIDDLDIVSVQSSSPHREADVLLASNVPPDALPFEDLPIVVLSEDLADEFRGNRSVRAWLPQNAPARTVVAAIEAAASGLVVLTTEQAHQYLGASRRAPYDDSAIVEQLTPREAQVLRMLASGLANKEIAGRLGISDHTAKFHVAQVLAKLAVSTRAEAVAVGIRRGLVPI